VVNVARSGSQAGLPRRDARTSGASRIVVVVEDDPRVRSFLCAALRGTARVLEAEDGEAALAVLERHAPDDVALVLVDQVNPKRSGLDVLRETRRRWPWIPVVIVTGFGSEELAIAALRAGARDYLKKPIGVNDLLAIVDRMMGAGSASRPLRGAAAAGDALPADTRHPNVARAIAFVREHFAEPIDLAGVAREAALSKFHLCRLFRQETGVSFRAYLRALRIERAKILLADRRMPVTEIAYCVGFNDVSRFDKNFGRNAGMSPTEYRKLISGRNDPDQAPGVPDEAGRPRRQPGSGGP